MFKAHSFSNSLFVLSPPEIVVKVSDLALRKMWQYVDQAPKEISWMGFCSRDLVNPLIFYVHDTLLFKQDCSPAYTEAADFALADVAEQILAEPDGKEKLKSMRLWGHSHVNMGTDPSGKDIEQTKMFAQGGCDWAIRLICNKSGKMSFSVMLYTEGLEVRDCKWEPLEEVVDPIKAEVAEQIKELVNFEQKKSEGISGVTWEKDKDGNFVITQGGKTKVYPTKKYSTEGRRFKNKKFDDGEQAFLDFYDLKVSDFGNVVEKKTGQIMYKEYEVSQFEEDAKEFADQLRGK